MPSFENKKKKQQKSNRCTFCTLPIAVAVNNNEDLNYALVTDIEIMRKLERQQNCILTGIFDVFKNSSNASSEPSVDACT